MIDRKTAWEKTQKAKPKINKFIRKMNRAIFRAIKDGKTSCSEITSDFFTSSEMNEIQEYYNSLNYNCIWIDDNFFEVKWCDY